MNSFCRFLSGRERQLNEKYDIYEPTKISHIYTNSAVKHPRNPIIH